MHRHSISCIAQIIHALLSEAGDGIGKRLMYFNKHLFDVLYYSTGKNVFM